MDEIKGVFVSVLALLVLYIILAKRANKRK